MTMAKVYFVHISDTHIGPTAVSPDHHGVFPWPCANRLVDIINRLPVQPDFVIHTGDVAYDADPAAYELAAATFSRLQVPIYYVNGNHDGVGLIKDCLPMGPKTDLSHDPGTLSYAFEVRGERFVVLDTRGPDDIDPQGLLSEPQLAVARAEAQPDGPPLTIFTHHPIWPLNSEWMDANMLVRNGRLLHDILLPARCRLRGVFHGHVHQPMQTVREGILYSSVASAYTQFAAWPGDVNVSHAFEDDPGYAFVHLLPGQTIVHQHTFPRPN
ncbi:MAG: metallophosphoesterase [Chloroflexi bacterium]|nr:metallophosphoesterase [Chloroflexota bacterium]MBP7045582.1 metallophosphoesterase [Chloroflexota bacterium]